MATKESVLNRVRLRVTKEEAEDNLLLDVIQAAIDRICLRVNESELPDRLESIAVEISMAAYNRLYREGIESEGVATGADRVEFVEDCMKPYLEEFSAHIEQKKAEADSKLGKVVFL